jgi:hypothetical protein
VFGPWVVWIEVVQLPEVEWSGCVRALAVAHIISIIASCSRLKQGAIFTVRRDSAIYSVLLPMAHKLVSLDMCHKQRRITQQAYPAKPPTNIGQDLSWNASQHGLEPHLSVMVSQTSAPTSFCTMHVLHYCQHVNRRVQLLTAYTICINSEPCTIVRWKKLS